MDVFNWVAVDWNRLDLADVSEAKSCTLGIASFDEVRLTTPAGCCPTKERGSALFVQHYLPLG